MGLILGEEVTQIVDPRLVEGLEGLEDEGRLRLPLSAGSLQLRRGGVDLLGVGTTPLLAQFVGPLLSLLKVLCHGGQVVGHGVHVLEILADVKVA